MDTLEYHNENFGGVYEFRCRKHTGDFVVNTHLHEYSEILYVDSGSADITVQNRRIIIPKKHLVFIPPNYVHRINCRNTTTICAVFSNDFIPLFFQRLGKNFLECSPVDFSKKPHYVDDLWQWDADDCLLISGKLYLICDEVLKQSRFFSGTPMDSTLYQRVVSYLQDNFSENITLKNLAKRFGYNEKYLSSAIHSLTGIHFSKLLAMYRINHARQLLSDEDIKISDIAFSCGFSAINTFNRVFRELVGKTPSEYRRLLIKYN